MGLAVAQFSQKDSLQPHIFCQQKRRENDFQGQNKWYKECTRLALKITDNTIYRTERSCPHAGQKYRFLNLLQETTQNDDKRERYGS
jgi:hypothetical protein